MLQPAGLKLRASSGAPYRAYHTLLVMQSLAALPPPPLPPSPTMLFMLPPNMARMSLGSDAALPDALARGQGRARIGRGGRLIFDRVHTLTHEELSSAGQNDDGVSPLVLHPVVFRKVNTAAVSRMV